MKKLLYGTTALVAAGMLSTGAYAADPIEISVGGYFAAGFAMMSQDDGVGQAAANTRDHSISREGEIWFTGSSTLDNGVTVGVNVQLEAETCGDQIDESFIWFEGSFGKLQIGAENGAAQGLNVGVPKPTNFFWGVNSAVMAFVSGGGNAVGNYIQYGNEFDGDQEKFTYYTPVLGGAQFGVSYTPDNKEIGVAGATGAIGNRTVDPDNNVGQQSEIMSIGARWTGDLGGAGIRIGGGYMKGNLEVSAAGSEDRDAWGAGVSISWNQFNFGTHYLTDDGGTSGDNTDRADWTVGANYSMGPWQFGVEYGVGSLEAGAGGGEDETTAFAVGVNYGLGGGVSVQAEIQWWDIDDNLDAAANENDATVFLVGTTLFF